MHIRCKDSGDSGLVPPENRPPPPSLGNILRRLCPSFAHTPYQIKYQMHYVPGTIFLLLRVFFTNHETKASTQPDPSLSAHPNPNPNPTLRLRLRPRLRIRARIRQRIRIRLSKAKARPECGFAVRVLDHLKEKKKKMCGPPDKKKKTYLVLLPSDIFGTFIRYVLCVKNTETCNVGYVLKAFVLEKCTSFCCHYRTSTPPGKASKPLFLTLQALTSKRLVVVVVARRFRGLHRKGVQVFVVSDVYRLERSS